MNHPKLERAVLYFRASSLDTAADLDRMQDRARAWAARQRLEIAQVRIEKPLPEDSRTDDLPEAVRALAAIRTTGATVLLLPSRDRAGNAATQAILERVAAIYGARVVAVDGSPAGARVETLVATLAAYHRTMARTQVRAAAQIKKERGERMGKLPWGFKVGKDGTHLVPNKAEERVVAIIRHMRAEGRTFKEIADFLAENGHRGRSGKPLALSAVFKLAKSPRYHLRSS
jgi:DNA invertase Pin-like site-specific DNA recombinase